MEGGVVQSMSGRVLGGFVIALAGALLAVWAHIPLPWMLGALLLTAATRIAGLGTACPRPARNGGQWVIGVKLPRRIVLHAGSAEAIMLDPHQPYAEHDAAAMSAHAELKHPHGKAVGHDKAHGKSVGHRKQTAAAPGDSN